MQGHLVHGPFFSRCFGLSFHWLAPTPASEMLVPTCWYNIFFQFRVCRCLRGQSVQPSVPQLPTDWNSLTSIAFKVQLNVSSPRREAVRQTQRSEIVARKRVYCCSSSNPAFNGVCVVPAVDSLSMANVRSATWILETRYRLVSLYSSNSISLYLAGFLKVAQL